jgi:hypothetical protein
VTLGFVLLVGSALLMQSLRKIRTTSPGFSTTRVFDTSISLTTAGYDVPRAKIFQDELIQRVRALPGVEAAAYARRSARLWLVFFDADCRRRVRTAT